MPVGMGHAAVPMTIGPGVGSVAWAKEVKNKNTIVRNITMFPPPLDVE
jgi:hypothetical protein